ACLPADDIELIATPATPSKILSTPIKDRSSAETKKLQAYYIAEHADEAVRGEFEQLAALRREQEKLLDSIPTTMVMEDVSPRRDQFRLVGGRYDQRGDKVTRGVPTFLPTPGRPFENRLALARWLVDPTNPLVARVAVNRQWQLFFGTGLVKTVDDFGLQG